MVNKYSLLLLCFIISFGTFLPQGRSSAATSTITISSESVNIRSGPGLSYPLTKIAKRGETYVIVKEVGEWIQIQLGLGKTGWVVNWLVTKSQGAKPGNSTATASSITTTATANTDQLRVRSGPGTSFRIIGFLNKGQAITVLDQNENWVKLSSTFGDGWVAREFIDFKTTNQENKAVSPSTTKTSTGIVNADTLNVRKEPSSTGVILGKLAKGTKITIYSKRNNWVEIGFSNLKGWVSAEFINNQASPIKETPQKESSTINGTVTVSSLNVRSDSSLNSNIVGAVSKGQRFTILAENNSWAKIEYKSGRFGWVASWYLDKSAVTTNPDKATKEKIVTILHNGTNIRKMPNVQSDVIKLANEGDSFSVIGLKNDWYEINLKNGKSGYVAGWIVSINGAKDQIVKPGAEGYLKNKTIVLDPGHGGADRGTTGVSGTVEKELTLRTARLLYDKLRAAGANVYLTRTNDFYVSLTARVNAAVANKADAFISLHYDSNYDRSIRGMTCYYYHYYQKSLADTLFASVVGQTKLRNRSVRLGDFHVIRENRQKAVLMELGYLSNPEEEITLKSAQFQENAASGLFNGLARFFKGN